MEPNVKKVIETIDNLSSLFGSATLLASVVEKFGLFEGVVQMDEESNWVFSQPEEQHCFSRADDGWAFPAFAAYVDDTQWSCPVGFGKHWVCLTFDVRSGDLLAVYPDDSPSERCWGTDDMEHRCAQVWAAAGKKIISRDLLERAGV